MAHREYSRGFGHDRLYPASPDLRLLNPGNEGTCCGAFFYDTSKVAFE